MIPSNIRYAIRETRPNGNYLPVNFPSTPWSDTPNGARVFPSVSDACYVIARNQLDACTIMRVKVGGVSLDGEVS